MLQSIEYRCGDRPPPQPGWTEDEPPKHEPDKNKEKPEDEKKPEKQQ